MNTTLAITVALAALAIVAGAAYFREGYEVKPLYGNDPSDDDTYDLED